MGSQGNLSILPRNAIGNEISVSPSRSIRLMSRHYDSGKAVDYYASLARITRSIKAQLTRYLSCAFIVARIIATLAEFAHLRSLRYWIEIKRSR